MIFDAAGVCLVSKNLVLLARRNFYNNGFKCDLGGYWSPFAGAIEDAEEPNTTASRELFEETGFYVSSSNLYPQKIILRDSKKFYLFFCFVPSFPDIKLDGEHSEYGVFKIESLHTLNPIDDDVLNCLQNYYNTNYISNKKNS